VLGATDDIPTKMLDVVKRVSPIRFFSPTSLELLRWVSERYVSSLAAVIVRSHPPRVASEEEGEGEELPPERDGPRPNVAPPDPVLASYRRGAELVDAIRSGARASFVVRPAPEDEQAVVVDAVGAALAAGRRAIVLVPEASPLPATAAAIEDAFGDRVGRLLGGDRRTRFRMWVDVRSGRYDVVVGTRPVVFAPIRDLGLVVVSRESHAAHREDRAPYYHVRDVALERARIESAVCVLSAFCPSSEAAVLGLPEAAPASRRWPPVEVVRPGPEGRAPRLLRVLREARRAFLYSPLPGYGIAAVCRSCGEPATCAACGGSLRVEGGAVRCTVCEAPGRCRRCGGADFGIRRGGEERVEEWASTVATVPVRRVGPSGRARLPRKAEVLVGGADDVRDLGPGGLDLVGILDADLADRRPGLTSRERALATWLEAAAWAAPAGRVIVQSNRAADPAVQALVRGDPARFHVDEARRRAVAGFPVGVAVFRVAGDERVVKEIEGFAPVTMLVTGAGERTVCLLALDPRRVPAFGVRIRELAAAGAVSRVEAEPHL
jgi:primosomal protein N' (replication factor Y) (superfamily II helicase)